MVITYSTVYYSYVTVFNAFVRGPVFAIGEANDQAHDLRIEDRRCLKMGGGSIVETCELLELCVSAPDEGFHRDRDHDAFELRRERHADICRDER